MADALSRCHKDVVRLGRWCVLDEQYAGLRVCMRLEGRIGKVDYAQDREFLEEPCWDVAVALVAEVTLQQDDVHSAAGLQQLQTVLKEENADLLLLLDLIGHLPGAVGPPPPLPGQVVLTADIACLDEALAEGRVRHDDSEGARSNPPLHVRWPAVLIEAVSVVEAGVTIAKKGCVGLRELDAQRVKVDTAEEASGPVVLALLRQMLAAFAAQLVSDLAVDVSHR